jgi:hypothetical protein
MDTLQEDQYACLIVPRSFLFRYRNVSDKRCTENKILILCAVTTFQKSCRLGDNVEKYCTVGQSADENRAHAHCMLGT